MASSYSATRPLPAVDIIPSEELFTYISPALLNVDFSDLNVKLTCILGTFFSSLAIFILFHFGAKLFFRTYGGLPLKHKIFMCLAVVRACYGVFGTLFGGFCVFWTSNLERDVVFGRTATSTFAMYVTVGFFMFELSAVILSDLAFGTFSKMLLVHHGLALISYSIAVNGEENYSFGTKALILEMSTPFSCLCFAMLKAGMERSILWKINQVILVHTFHMRSVLECHMWYLTYQNWDYIVTYMPAASFYLLYAQLSLVTFLMTPYWGYKKTQQLFKPVDWNFQESRKTGQYANGIAKKAV